VDKLRVERAKPWHVLQTARNLRAWDQYEIPVMNGKSASRGVFDSYRHAEIQGGSVAVMAGDTVLVLAGSCPTTLISNSGSLYAFATRQYDEYVTDAASAMHIAEVGKMVVRALLGCYTSLSIAVLCEDKKNARWLRWMGFERAGLIRRGPYQVDCVRYVLGGNVECVA